MQNHTETPWKIWHSGYANAPYIIYTGDAEPILKKDTLSGGKFLPHFPQGCIYIGEISSQRMHLDENEDIVVHQNAAFIITAVNSHKKLVRSLKAIIDYAGDAVGQEESKLINDANDALEAAGAA